MKELLVAVLSVALIVSLTPGTSPAQPSCPAEVDQAKEMLSKKTASVKPEDVQAPRAMAGARQDPEAARGNQNVQSPRGNQDVQSPRGNQDVQSPRGNQNVQSPRAGTDATASSQAPRSSLTRATSLVKEAEAACKAGNMSLASKKAKSAIALLKK